MKQITEMYITTDEVEIRELGSTATGLVLIDEDGNKYIQSSTDFIKPFKEVKSFHITPPKPETKRIEKINGDYVERQLRTQNYNAIMWALQSSQCEIIDRLNTLSERIEEENK